MAAWELSSDPASSSLCPSVLHSQQHQAVQRPLEPWGGRPRSEAGTAATAANHPRDLGALVYLPGRVCCSRLGAGVPGDEVRLHVKRVARGLPHVRPR